MPIAGRRTPMTKTLTYWIATTLVVLIMLLSGVLDVLRSPAVMTIVIHLGYPPFVCVILGVGKLLAVLALLDPRTRFLREWAYAGITFDMIGAFISHLEAHDPLANILTPLIVLALTTASYLLRPEKLKLRSAA